MKPLGVFGGTFDPIHFGHLRTAFELLAALDLDEIRFVPAGSPPHRETPLADAAFRLDLVEAAIAGQPGFAIDAREVRRPGPSYMVLTLRELRAEFPVRPLCLVLGMDAFLGLPEWYEWRELVELAHLVVAHRPGWQAPADGPLRDLLVARRTDRIGDLHELPAGRILVRSVTQLEISSTELRTLLADGQDPRYLVPEAVREAIRATGRYIRPTRLQR
jgi:nicotinate-nucleotide adenylyltransferase